MCAIGPVVGSVIADALYKVMMQGDTNLSNDLTETRFGTTM